MQVFLSFLRIRIQQAAAAKVINEVNSLIFVLYTAAFIERARIYPDKILENKN